MSNNDTPSAAETLRSYEEPARFVEYGVQRSSAASKAASRSASHHRWLVPLLIGLLTAIVFAPSVQNGFVAWDDPKNFLDNPHYRGLGATQLKWMWTTFHMGHYIPLSWMTLGLDYLFWGMNPAGYHATSVVFHALNSVVLYFLARRLFALAAKDAPVSAAPPSERFIIPAAVAALFFALHPLRVESVVWITERRDTLSLLFYQLSVMTYLRASDADAPRWRPRWYFAALMLFVCALLSKATAMTLPAVLALLNVYPLRRVKLVPPSWPEIRRVAVELAPFALLSAAVVILSIVALRPPTQLPLSAKLAVSAYSLAFYVFKTIAPVGLSPLYEMPAVVRPGATVFLLSYVSCAAVAVVAFAIRRKWPGAATAIVAFVLISLPMLGIVQNGPQIAADRYTYHAAPALAILASAVLLMGTPLPAVATRVAAAAVALALAALTWQQIGVWRDSDRLWSRALELDSTSAIAHSAMSSLLFKRGADAEGMAHAEQSVQLAPGYPEAHNGLGVGLSRQGRLAEAAESYRRAIDLQPTYDEAVNNLGIVAARQGDLAGAIGHYRRALELNPDYADAHVNWGNALVREKRYTEAIAHYQSALVIRPDHDDAHHNWGVALAQQGRFDEAIDQFRKALAINPANAEAKEYLDRAARLLGRP